MKRVLVLFCVLLSYTLAVFLCLKLQHESRRKGVCVAEGREDNQALDAMSRRVQLSCNLRLCSLPLLVSSFARRKWTLAGPTTTVHKMDQTQLDP